MATDHGWEPEQDLLGSLWAKLSNASTPPTFHPLLCHMLDTAAVAEYFWQRVLTDGARRDIAKGFGCSPDHAGKWVRFISALHDLGKASPAFQVKDPTAVRRLMDAGLPCATGRHDAPHGTVTTRTLSPILESAYGVNPETSRRIAAITGGHHGVFPTANQVDVLREESVGGRRWDRLRSQLVSVIAHSIGVSSDTAPVHVENNTAMTIAGFISTADWIASNETYFSHAAVNSPDSPAIDVNAYERKQERRTGSASPGLACPARKGTSTFVRLSVPKPSAAAHPETGVRTGRLT